MKQKIPSMKASFDLALRSIREPNAFDIGLSKQEFKEKVTNLFSDLAPFKCRRDK